MSFEGDSSQHENDVKSDNEEIIKLLKAILLGIETIIGRENELLEEVE